MNKQEAIEKIKNIDTLNIKDRMDDKGVDMVIKNQVLDIISQIDEPQKVVVPKFVAEWIEDHKGDYNKWDEEAKADFVFRSINDLFRFGEGFSPCDFTIDEKFSEWTTKNAYKFITAILFGYEIEQEKLCTVEIPDPYGIYKILYLFRNNMGNIRIRGDDYRDALLNAKAHLTESEIKQDFEWAWQWAKEVGV